LSALLRAAVGPRLPGRPAGEVLGVRPQTHRPGPEERDYAVNTKSITAYVLTAEGLKK
jgi:hypothetical protein